MVLEHLESGQGTHSATCAARPNVRAWRMGSGYSYFIALEQKEWPLFLLGS